MKDNIEKDVLIRKIIQESGTENPSEDFTKLVLLKIQNEKLESKLIFHPLISKPVWIGITVLCLSACVSFFLGATTLNFSSSVQNSVSYVSEFLSRNSMFDLKVNDIGVYGILGFAILFLAEIPLLKKLLDY